ncbi:DUF6174 domain-containing protein [Cellulomonas sp. PhB150]|uniref:DUF6174 domain-containing protein n=1 Tax=Cellulomonas sp. PhB150 TaxID=2485188 RepID=UPI000F48F708|nr:DUF6174 domain-containing protein [Cellulomonas sp. PhB150]ROS25917.1 hypothetical protein EDF34_2241 [Cellulomonas sp. PhB150]
MGKILRVLGLGVVLVGGCSSGGGSTSPPGPAVSTTTAQPDWSTASYRYTIESSCGERAFLGTFHVTVTNGRITTVVPVDDRAAHVVDGDLPTIADLLQRAQADGLAAPSEFHVDRDTGVPTTIRFEGDPNAIDDEECYRISGYAPVG